MKRIIGFIGGGLLCPFFFILKYFLCQDEIRLIVSDLRRWCEWQNMYLSLFTFCRLFVVFKEFRSTFYIRTNYRFYVLRQLLPGQVCCQIGSEQGIGEGLLIQHGYYTTINTTKIGRNLRVNQNVTIPWNEKPSIIGHDVIIRANAMILDGVTIGNGVLVGAGSVVRNNIPAYAIVMGNPAKVIGFNKTPEEASKYEIETNIPIEDRVDIQILEKNYKKYFTSRLCEIQNYVKL